MYPSGRRVFADVIKVRMMSWIGVSSESSDKCPGKRRKKGQQGLIEEFTWRQRKRCSPGLPAATGQERYVAGFL
jgi:hypothetical protein